jgi:drug/metabolite transporter (DMT)-like permease
LPLRQVITGVLILLVGFAGILAASCWCRSALAPATPGAKGPERTLLQFGAIALAGAVAAVADTLIKRAATGVNNVGSLLLHPLMLLALGLYLLQIALFSYVFVRNWNLGIVGLSQMIAYAATVVVVGIVVFHERISLSHGVGLALAFIAVVLMNL